MSVIFYSLGAAEEVTGSKHVFEIDGRPFLVDCGAFQGKWNESDQKNRDFHIAADKIESVILTHAHYDHCGLLPMLGKNGFRGNIYATPATRDLASLIMMDSANIQARDAEYHKKQASKKGQKFSWAPLFTEKDVVFASNQIVSLSYNRKMYIAPDVQVEFFDAGHILGSAFAFVTITGQTSKKDTDNFFTRMQSLFHANEQKEKDPSEDEIRILFTGDLGRNHKPIIRDPETKVPAADYIVLESTYGNRKHEKATEAMDMLEKVVKKAIQKGGKIIIPAFAIERTQELVYYFHRLFEERKLPEIPIYVDSPMATNATSIFQVHPECYDKETHDAFLTHHKNPFGFNALTFVQSVGESKALNNKEGPMIIISADGMCEAGRIVHHVYNNIEDPNTTILLVGFMAENTLGRKLQNRETEVRIMGEWKQVKAEIEQINAFSAHADYTEIKTWLSKVDTSRLKKIFLVHGEPDAQDFLKKELINAGYPEVEIIRYGNTYELN
ncbi:MAG: MBL fold metallo-hydrolase [Treponemataceae bacterium]|nr:MBL fold metallo-hydrolase [Treponemataceae bacterium]